MSPADWAYGLRVSFLRFISSLRIHTLLNYSYDNQDGNRSLRFIVRKLGVKFHELAQLAKDKVASDSLIGISICIYVEFTYLQFVLKEVVKCMSIYVCMHAQMISQLFTKPHYDAVVNITRM